MATHDHRTASRDPAISVLVVAVGASAGLRACLDEIRRQASPVAAEIVLVLNDREDALDPGNRADLESRIDRLAFEPTPGKSHALNHGVRLCRGEVIAFTDDDAHPQAGWLAAITAPLLDPHRPDDLVGCGGRVIPRLPDAGVPAWYRELLRSRRSHFLGPRHELGDEPTDYDPHRTWVAPLGANCAYLRTVFDRHAYPVDLGPNRATGLHGGEEIVLGARLLLEGRTLVYRPDARVDHPVVPQRMTLAWVRRACFAQGIEKVRIDRHLRGKIPSLAKSVTRYVRAAARLALGPLVGEMRRVVWTCAYETRRGTLTEVRRVRAAARGGGAQNRKVDDTVA